MIGRVALLLLYCFWCCRLVQAEKLPLPSESGAFRGERALNVIRSFLRIEQTRIVKRY